MNSQINLYTTRLTQTFAKSLTTAVGFYTVRMAIRSHGTLHLNYQLQLHFYRHDYTKRTMSEFKLEKEFALFPFSGLRCHLPAFYPSSLCLLQSPF